MISVILIPVFCFFFFFFLFLNSMCKEVCVYVLLFCVVSGQYAGRGFYVVFFGCVLCLLGVCVGGSVWGRVGGRDGGGGGGGGPGVGGQGGKGKVRSEGRGTIGSSKERLSVGDEGGSEEEGSGKVVGWGGWVMMGKGREGAGGHGGR